MQRRKQINIKKISSDIGEILGRRYGIVTESVLTRAAQLTGINVT